MFFHMLNCMDSWSKNINIELVWACSPSFVKLTTRKTLSINLLSACMPWLSTLTYKTRKYKLLPIVFFLSFNPYNICIKFTNDKLNVFVTLFTNETWQQFINPLFCVIANWKLKLVNSQLQEVPTFYTSVAIAFVVSLLNEFFTSLYSHPVVRILWIILAPWSLNTQSHREEREVSRIRIYFNSKGGPMCFITWGCWWIERAL